MLSTMTKNKDWIPSISSTALDPVPCLLSSTCYHFLPLAASGSVCFSRVSWRGRWGDWLDLLLGFNAGVAAVGFPWALRSQALLRFRKLYFYLQFISKHFPTSSDFWHFGYLVICQLICIHLWIPKFISPFDGWFHFIFPKTYYLLYKNFWNLLGLLQ